MSVLLMMQILLDQLCRCRFGSTATSTLSKKASKKVGSLPTLQNIKEQNNKKPKSPFA